MTTNLDLFTDYVCPWCYFMTKRIERLRGEYDIHITRRAFPLHPDTPEEGWSLDIIYDQYPYPKEDMIEHLRRNARALEMPYCERSKTFNTRLAQELGCWAEEKGYGDAFHNAAFKSYFVDHENMAKKKVLLGIVKNAGMDPEEAEMVLASRSHAQAVEKDWGMAERLGITVVPTFVIGENKLEGAREYRSLSRFVSEKGVAKKLIG